MVAYLWLAQAVPAGASMEDGFSADQIFGTHTGYTYDDLVVLPGHVSFDSNKVDLSTNLTRNLKIHLPYLDLHTQLFKK